MTGSIDCAIWFIDPELHIIRTTSISINASYVMRVKNAWPKRI